MDLLLPGEPSMLFEGLRQVVGKVNAEKGVIVIVRLYFTTASCRLLAVVVDVIPNHSARVVKDCETSSEERVTRDLNHSEGHCDLLYKVVADTVISIFYDVVDDRRRFGAD